MTNLKNSRTAPVSSAHPEWLAVTAGIGAVANHWAGRSDIVVAVSPSSGRGNPACYSPLTGELEINTPICFGDSIDPEMVGAFGDRETQYEWPRATGAIFHEAMHARFSQWDLEQASKDLSNREFRALVLLEEGRIENQGLEAFPRMSGFLRTMAIDVVINDPEDLKSSSDSEFAANVATLTLARVDAGSLRSSDVEEIRDLIANRIGEDRLEKLRGIWLEAQNYRDHYNAAGMYDLAREWVKIVDEAKEENGEEPGDEESEPGESGSGSGSGSGYVEDLMDAMSEAAADAAIAAYDDLAESEMLEDYEEQAKAKADSGKERRDAKDAAGKVFGSGTAEIHNTSSRSSISETRNATPDERRAAVKIGAAIDKAKYRDRSETEIVSDLPPGRLRTRVAVQGAALRSKGVMTKTEPWRRTVRKQTDDPTLKIGVMVDISGSMYAAMEPMASTAWIMSEAGRRVDAKTAMVYYGNDVFATLKPGQRLDKVRVWTAPDGTEKFDKAFKALDGGLNLLHGSGVRMLVIVSDGEYTGPETEAARRWVRRCEEAGVAVIWINSSTYGTVRRIINGTSVIEVPLSGDATTAAELIGQAASKALAKVA